MGTTCITNLLFGCAIGAPRGPDASGLPLFRQKNPTSYLKRQLDELLNEVFTEIYLREHPPSGGMPAAPELRKGIATLEAINCTNIPGAETVNILATRYGGTVFFLNLINNYNIAVYITESISRRLTIRCAGRLRRNTMNLT